MSIYFKRDKALSLTEDQIIECFDAAMGTMKYDYSVRVEGKYLLLVSWLSEPSAQAMTAVDQAWHALCTIEVGCGHSKVVHFS